MFGFHLIQWIVSIQWVWICRIFTKKHLLGKISSWLLYDVPAASSLEGFFSWPKQYAWEELWVLSCFLWEADDLSRFVSLKWMPPPQKKKRENQGNFAEPGANLSLKKVMVQTNFHMTPTFLGPWFSHSKTPDGQLENPGEIWSEKQKDTTTWTFQFWNAWTKCFRGTGCQFTMTLAGFSLSNPTGRCWSSKLHLSSMSFIASGTFQTKGKKTERGWYISFGMLPPSYSPLRSFLS